MIIYAILSSSDNPGLGDRIEVTFPGDTLKISDSQWLVAVNATPQDVSARLGIGDGTYGQVAVFGIEGYFGWHRRDMWDWIALKRKL